MYIPSSTYRIQFNSDFKFTDLQRIIEYLHTLGISTIYASPIVQAAPGSTHGYDVTDPHAINSEIGSLEELKSIAKELRKKEMQWLQDIVPNHMAFHTTNWRLMDVLERGMHSTYHKYFDIQWDHPAPELTGKVMVPFLGKPLDDCIQQKEIKLAFSPDGFTVNYFDTAYPLSASAFQIVIDEQKKVNENMRWISTLSKLQESALSSSYQHYQQCKKNFVEAIAGDQTEEASVEQLISIINDNTVLLTEIINHQYYQLCYWKYTDRQINYRRFFTVNELICLRMEDKEVFDEYHTFLHDLFKNKIVQGFRIDHIDGLQDPAAYTHHLRHLTDESCYIIAEKILEAKEEMPEHWPLQGTSGYEFLSYLSQLFTDRKGAKELLTYYKKLVPDIPPYRKLIFESKKLILTNYMAGEWDNLFALLNTLGLTGNFESARMKHALALLMLSLPVYRIYADRVPLKGKSLLILHEAFEKANGFDAGYHDELKHLMELFVNTPNDENHHHQILKFMRRLMQFTGPLTAKGVEDTTFYIYNPLISHDEVGDAPSTLGITINTFHDKMKAREASSPLSLNATATHDTKRGEDARIRLNILSEIPGIWELNVSRWFEINSKFRQACNEKIAPELNDEYFIYQSIIGGFPEDLKVTEEWLERLKAYLQKAFREAKVNTNWSEPDTQYENICAEFVTNIFRSDHNFLENFIPLMKVISDYATIYALCNTLIKLTAPGIPDIYQGCELWDFSFVDPDNRRPVDYNRRMEFLFQLVLKEQKGKEELFTFLADNRSVGIQKLFLIWKVLNFRKKHAALFTDGSYTQLYITGKTISAAAFARHIKNQWIIVAIPIGIASSDNKGHHQTDQYIILPEGAPDHWINLFTNEKIFIPNQISLTNAFQSFPVALLYSSIQ